MGLGGRTFLRGYDYREGKVSNRGAGLGGGTLASAGGGVRAGLGNGIEASAELGVPLKASPFDADPGPRFSFTLGVRF
jgi:hemolysin activation/secretion protein